MTGAQLRDDFWSRRRVLVTGAYGFLAGHLIEALVDIGAEVVGMVRDRPARSYLQLSGLDEQITLAAGDITSLSDCLRVVNDHECTVVFHLAAQAIVGAANRSPLPTFANNIMGTCNILEACRQLNATERSHLVDCVVVASSDKAYGDQPTLPYTEAAPLLGLHPYDASKSCADLLARSYHKTYGLTVSVTRCGNLYGPGDLNMSRIVPDTIRALLADQAPIIRSDGSPKRDYLYVKDAAQGYLLLAQQTAVGNAAGQAYNIGTGRPVTVLELVSTIVQASGKTHLQPEIQATSWGEIIHQYLDCTRANTELGWTPQYRLEEALSETYEWYRSYLASDVDTQCNPK